MPILSLSCRIIILLNAHSLPQDNAIRHLTDKQTWYDLESHSLSASRAASVAADHETLSDGYLSDSAMDDSKEKNKKKKAWRVHMN